MDIPRLGALEVISQLSAQPREAAAQAPVLFPTSTSTPAPAATPTPDDVREAVKEIERNLSSNSTDLRFSVDNSTGKTVVSVLDSQTKEVIRQIPAEEVMQMARFLDRMQGLLVKGKA